MKKLLSVSQKIILGVMLICIGSFNNGVQANAPDSDKNNGVTTESIIEPTFREVDNRVFINWKITGLTKDCLFFVQRSINDSEFETIEIKQGMGGNASLTVLYCHIDDENIEGVVKYQVKRIDIEVIPMDRLAGMD